MQEQKTRKELKNTLQKIIFLNGVTCCPFTDIVYTQTLSARTHTHSQTHAGAGALGHIH